LDTTPRSPESSSTFFGRHEFLIRRLHSLSGLVPVGAYMVVHLLTNASVLNGAGTFQDQVDTIHSLGAALPIVEWTFIFLPLLFHAVLGVVFIFGWVPNTTKYPLRNNIRYTLQRVTGMIAFAFILFHVLHLHGLGSPLAKFAPDLFHQFDPHHATSTAAAALRYAAWLQAFYVIGLLSCIYHLANGLWTMGITWGVWTTPAAQRRADYVCLAFGLFLTIVGLSAFYGMQTTDLREAQAIEELRQQQREQEMQEKDAIRRALEAAQPAASASAAASESGAW
jgi:succinate dehydrogenase / fumarate reductase cytochrome b subunit